MHSQSFLLHSPSHTSFQIQEPKFLSQSFILFKKPPLSLATTPSKFHTSFLSPSLSIVKSRSRLVTHCISKSQELVDIDNPVSENDVNVASDSFFVEEEEEKEKEMKMEGLESQSIWKQIKEIVMFTAPATGLWICGPLMSLIDTAVIGQGSSLELAALGPGTVLCDNMSYVFMFLSISTSNIVATSLAKQDKNEVQHQLSVLLFIGLTCGFLMVLFNKFFASSVLTAFTGSNNLHLVPVANTYVQVHFFKINLFLLFAFILLLVNHSILYLHPKRTITVSWKTYNFPWISVSLLSTF